MTSTSVPSGVSAAATWSIGAVSVDGDEGLGEQGFVSVHGDEALVEHLVEEGNDDLDGQQGRNGIIDRFILIFLIT